MFSLSIHNGIARLAIARPAARNAVALAGWRQFAGLVAEVAAARPAAVLLHAQPGAVFSAGADLKELAGLASDADLRAPFRIAMAAAFAAMRALTMPTIAVIEGGCHGAGVALAMACDLRVASPAARFAIPPARLGILYPPEDVARLVALVGEGQAIRLLAGGDAIDGSEAAQIGLVELLADDAHAAAEALAIRIAANDAASVAALKRFVREGDASGGRAFEDGFGSAAFAAWAAARG